LLQGAVKAKFSNDLWTCPRVCQLIRRRFGVQYHVDHIGRLLRSMDWSPQKPQRRAATAEACNAKNRCFAPLSLIAPFFD
jgi:transposase